MINNLDSIILGIKDGEKAIEDLRVVLKKKKRRSYYYTDIYSLSYNSPNAIRYVFMAIAGQ